MQYDKLLPHAVSSSKKSFTVLIPGVLPEVVRAPGRRVPASLGPHVDDDAAPGQSSKISRQIRPFPFLFPPFRFSRLNIVEKTKAESYKHICRVNLRFARILSIIIG